MSLCVVFMSMCSVQASILSSLLVKNDSGSTPETPPSLSSMVAGSGCGDKYYNNNYKKNNNNNM